MTELMSWLGMFAALVLWIVVPIVAMASFWPAEDALPVSSDESSSDPALITPTSS